MSALTAGLWFLGCWFAAGCIAAWVWCRAFGFNTHDDGEQS